MKRDILAKNNINITPNTATVACLVNINSKQLEKTSAGHNLWLLIQFVFLELSMNAQKRIFVFFANKENN